MNTTIVKVTTDGSISVRPFGKICKFSVMRDSMVHILIIEIALDTQVLTLQAPNSVTSFKKGPNSMSKEFGWKINI